MLEEIFEGKCPACGSSSRLDMPLCHSCLEELKIPTDFCFTCGFALTKEKHCPKCGGAMPDIDNIYSIFKYSFPIRELILSIKFKYNIRSAHFLYKLLEGRLPKLSSYDCIIAIPSHFIRRFRRFYHPTDLFASYIAHNFKIKQLHFLKRVRNTRLQATLTKLERKKNIKNAFSIKNKPNNIESVLLIDDILTTASTANEASRILREAGVKRIDLLVLSK